MGKNRGNGAVVEGCDDCPFKNTTYVECNVQVNCGAHPNKLLCQTFHFNTDTRKIEHDYKPPPSWCPLRDGPFVVVKNFK